MANVTVTTNNRIADVDRMVDKMLKLSDDIDRRRIAPDLGVKKARIASVIFSGISLRRKLANDARQMEIDVSPKKGQKQLAAAK